MGAVRQHSPWEWHVADALPHEAAHVWCAVSRTSRKRVLAVSSCQLSIPHTERAGRCQFISTRLIDATCGTVACDHHHPITPLMYAQAAATRSTVSLKQPRKSSRTLKRQPSGLSREPASTSSVESLSSQGSSFSNRGALRTKISSASSSTTTLSSISRGVVVPTAPVIVRHKPPPRDAVPKESALVKRESTKQLYGDARVNPTYEKSSPPFAADMARPPSKRMGGTVTPSDDLARMRYVSLKIAKFVLADPWIQRTAGKDRIAVLALADYGRKALDIRTTDPDADMRKKADLALSTICLNLEILKEVSNTAEARRAHCEEVEAGKIAARACIDAAAAWDRLNADYSARREHDVEQMAKADIARRNARPRVDQEKKDDADSSRFRRGPIKLSHPPLGHVAVKGSWYTRVFRGMKNIWQRHTGLH